MGGRYPSVLKELELIKGRFGGKAAGCKLDLLTLLEKAVLLRSKEVLRLHEVLCFLRAYPDSPEVLGQVERMLEKFSDRRDLKRHRKALANSGIAGTVITFPFFWFTAYWLAQRWPDRISIDWSGFDKKDRLADMLHLLVTYTESTALDELSHSPREWINHLKGPTETDADFLIRRFKKLVSSSFGRETTYESLDIPIRLATGPGTPNRTHARYPKSPIVFQDRPLARVRTTFRREIRNCPITVRSLPAGDARTMIHLAREAMVTRSRDLDVFEHADERDIRLVTCDRGYQFACIGVVPERRLMLESVYGFLTLKNGVPIGYLLVGSLFNSSEVAFNMFETVRGAESGLIYSRVLAMVKHLFGSDTFMVPPYQLGHNNQEALESGAWWFYYKLGFRPKDAGVRRLLKTELRKIKRHPRHRTDIATLNELSSENMYLSLNSRRKDVMGEISLGDIGLKVAHYLAERFGADRELGLRACSAEAIRRLGVRSFKRYSAGELLTWKRWSPLVMLLDGVDGWTPAEKHALVEVVRAKGGRRESRFVELFNRHRRLQRAILRLLED
jgi:hypothetical protein